MLAAGRTLGPYKILARVGVSGMGEFYCARDTRPGRDVAIKVLPPHLAATAEVHARFERDGRLVAQQPWRVMGT
jgi:serine/threonine protein kinase